MKLWGGRFSQEQSKIMKLFNDSFRFDHRLYMHDIHGSQAYANGLNLVGLITNEENEKIQTGLAQILEEFDNELFAAKPGDEDIHTAVERRLYELIGNAAGKLHTGRSRNDQVALDLRLFVMNQIRIFKDLLTNMQKTLINKAETHIDVIMPGYTHLQPAQPILFSHWLMSFFWMFQRDKERLEDAYKRAAVSPLGSGALAGNSFGLDREKLAADLGMPTISQNSLDAVSDRDFITEFLFSLSLSAVHISRLAEDLILYSNPALGFIAIDEKYSTGSSLMPQKRNPDSMELARGKTGRIISALVNLLIVLKGLPSTYNKDLQEDKEPMFDSVNNFHLTLTLTTAVIESIKVLPDKMAAQLDEGMLATDLADYLVERGLPFREAHHKIGEIIRYTEEQQIPLSNVPIEKFTDTSPLFQEDVVQILDFYRSISQKDSVGGTAPQSVVKQINKAKELLTRF